MFRSLSSNIAVGSFSLISRNDLALNSPFDFVSGSLSAFGQSTTSTPMLRAVPAIIEIAASIFAAFKSFIFVSAIS